MRLLRVNMGTGKMEWESLREDWLPIGGSALLARIMNREVPPTADPLGPENAFLVAVGPLAGTGAPQLGRISVGAKSPLTLGIKEANAGGPAGQFLDRLGIRAIIVHGAPPEGRLSVLSISEDGAALIPAEGYRGLKNYELAGRLRKKYGQRAAVISTGPAGERKYRGASVSFTDLFGDPSRNAARGGLGAVMGSKGLTIVIDPGKTGPVETADPDAFRRLVESWVNTLKHDVSCSLYSRFGTAGPCRRA